MTVARVIAIGSLAVAIIAVTNGKIMSRDLGGLLASSLILGLEHPSSLTGDTHFCFGRLAFLSPIKSTP
jgi:hypothetical protein